MTPTSKPTMAPRRTVWFFFMGCYVLMCICRLTKKAEPPPTDDVNREGGTKAANGGWLRRLVRPHGHSFVFSLSGSYQYSNPLRLRTPREPRKTKRAVNRARVKKECARILRPEVTTVSAKMANRP